MSVKVMGWVWDADLPKEEKFILLAYADHADHEGNSIYPSVGLIAKKTGYTDRGVRKIKSRLIEAGILVQYDTRQSGIPVYFIRRSHLNIKDEPQKTPALQTPPPERGSAPPLNGVQPPPERGSAKPSVKPSIEPSALEHSLFSELATLLDVPKELMLPKMLRAMDNFILDLLEMDAQPGDIAAFGKWWYDSDWRGLKAQKPTLNQIRENWNTAKQDSKSAKVVIE